MTLTREQARELLRAIQLTRSEEINCDEWLHRAPRLVELLKRGQPLPAEIGVVAQHVQVCRNCDEELSAMLSAMNGEPRNTAKE